MSRNFNVLKSGIWYTFSNFLVSGMSFLTTPIFTRLMSQNEYGLYNNYISWQGILIIFVSLNVKASLISARYDYERDFDKFIFSVLSMSMLSTLTWMLFLNLVPEWTEKFFSMNVQYINLMLIYIICLTALELFQAKQCFLFRYKMQVFVSLLTSLSTVGLSVILVEKMSDKLSGRIEGHVIPTIIVGTILYIYFILKGRRLDFSHWKYAFKFCLPFIPHLLSLTILSSMDRVMITKFCGEAYTALYSVAYNCGYMISILLASMNTAYGPWLAERLHENDAQSIRKYSKVYITAFVYIAIGVMAIAPEALLILGGKPYLSAKYVMTPVAMGCVCQFLYTMFVNVEQIKKKTVGMAFASVSAALLNYVLNMLLIPRFGYIAAAYTTLVGYLWLLTVHMILVHRLKMSNVYSYRFVIMIIVIVGICTVGISLLYANDIARYIFVALYVGIFFVVAYLMRNKIKYLLHAFTGKIN